MQARATALGMRPAAPKQPPPSFGGLKRKIDQVAGPVSQAPRPKVPTVRPVGSVSMASASRMPTQAPKGQPTKAAPVPFKGSIRPLATLPSGSKPSMPKQSGQVFASPAFGASSSGAQPPSRPPSLGPVGKAKPSQPAAKPLISAAQHSSIAKITGGMLGSRTAPPAKSGTIRPVVANKPGGAPWARGPPGGAAPAAQAPMPPQKGPGASGAISAATALNKQVVKLRKVEALCRSMLEEWGTMDEDKKEEAVTTIGARFLEKVPVEFLEKLADQIAMGVADGLAIAASSNGTSDVGKKQLVAKEPEAAAAKAPDIEAAESLGDEAGDGDSNRFSEAMKEFFQAAKTLSPKQWPQAFANVVVSPEDEAGGITALFEAAVRDDGGGGAELASKIMVELAKSQHVQMKPIEQALEVLARRLETLVEENDTAWHLHSHVLTLMFPQATSSRWGLCRAGWNWNTWWAMAQKVLDACDQYRAFDIMVYVLQMMQEKSDAVIKQQQAWKEPLRVAKVRKALCGWGVMDDVSITSTLMAYGVEI